MKFFTLTNFHGHRKIICDGFVTILEIPPKWTVFTYKIPNFDSKCCYRVLYALMGSIQTKFPSVTLFKIRHKSVTILGKHVLQISIIHRYLDIYLHNITHFPHDSIMSAVPIFLNLTIFTTSIIGCRINSSLIKFINAC